MSDAANQPAEPLLPLLRAKISAHGPINVAQFMKEALYHPQYGYYTSGPDIGPRGDFVTSPEASPAFGALLAEHIADVDRLLGAPHRLDIIECGPGTGALADDLLDTLRRSHPDIYARVRYWLVEISPALRRSQRARLLPSHEGAVEWRTGLSGLPTGLQGAVIANELIDAFPVHVLEMRDGIMQEQFVGLDGSGALEIELLPVTDRRLTDFLREERIVLAEGDKVEVNLLAGEWLAALSSRLDKGVVALIDYGDEAPARYSQSRREGTLLGYYRGGVTSDILAHPGEQDLTALVDFTALQRSAVRAGMDVVGITRQSSFLLGLGLGSSHTPESVCGDDVEAALKYRRGLQSLVSMEGLGRFHVLLLVKGCAVDEARSGLSGMRYAGYLA